MSDGDMAWRLLLVEDDADNREAMTMLLSSGGFAVTSAGSGADAVRAFGAAPFDLVLTDLDLPDMDGFAVAGNCKQAAPAVPVALITGFHVTGDAAEIRRRGIDLVLRKPLEPRVLVDQLRELAQAGGRSPSA